MKLTIAENEYWWGGCVNLGHEMPFHKNSHLEFNLETGRENDQFAPLLLSSSGRYIWSDQSFSCIVHNGIIVLNGKGSFDVQEGHQNLKGAYLAAMKAHFPFNGKIPDPLFWKVPQYNTWIELGTNQTTEGILQYAKDILANGLPAGVLMIDGGWQEDYGVYEEFNERKIPDPKYLIDELHKLGFKVMVWVSPIVASAGPRYKQLRDKGYLIKNAQNEIAIRKWWSGYSAVLDFSNPDAVLWMQGQLNSLIERYGIDGFKFDAGDCYFYEDDDIIYKNIPAREQTYEFNKMGEIYRFNEYRAAWNFGGRPIVARLHDKYHSWDSFGLNTLIPHTILQGLLGYAYCCPDMVGGGIINCFTSDSTLDEELFVRWAQTNALMGMMQISRSPWNVLSSENTKLVLDAIQLHASYGEKLYALALHAAKTGEPITRCMCYEFPEEGFETVNDQFMLGSDILVAPVLVKGAENKSVKLPKGKWKYFDGTVYEGGTTVVLSVNLSTLPYFKKI